MSTLEGDFVRDTATYSSRSRSTGQAART